MTCLGKISALLLSIISLQSFAANYFNPCDVYDTLKNPLRAEIVDLRILKPKGYAVGIMIIGTPKNLRVTANGIDISSKKTKTEEIICSNHRAGETAWYDLKDLKADAVYIEVSSGSIKRGASITF